MGSTPDHMAGGVEGRAFPAPLPASPRWGEVQAPGEAWRAQPSTKKPNPTLIPPNRLAGAAKAGGVEGAALHKKT